MALAPGSRVGAYEVTARIGTGGMGQVYRATDTALERQVAIKILPDTFASDPDRLARFEREARTLASLNHPHIATIYAVEKSAGLHALVMELVEGEDLSQRIARGAIPLEDALPIARQIAEALEAAHEQGIIHRDLKPPNIKVRPDGTVKVLDFGLAKAIDHAGTGGAAADITNSPTITSPAMTVAGMILGTAAYMSPEQAKGRAVDRRTDVWAFGAVLYEMLTGTRCFYGTDVSDTLAAILRAEPDWTALPADTPPAVRRLLRRCLEKDLHERQPDIAIARLELRDAETETREERRPAIAAARPRASVLRRTAPYAAVVAASVVTALVVWQMRRPTDAPHALARFSIDLPQSMQLTGPNRNPVAISPDGTRMVIGANQRLYMRTLDQVEATPIVGTEEGGTSGFGRSPFFSPDGEWIGFWQQGRLKKVATSGGAPITIAEAANYNGASWGVDGRIFWGGPEAVMSVSATGGNPEPLIQLKDGFFYNPQLLPDGEWILFTFRPRGKTFEQSQAVVQSLKTGERRVLFESVRDAYYLASGHLLYGRANTLLAQAFDPVRLAVHGAPQVVLEGVNNGGGVSVMHVALSSTGTMLYVPGSGPVATPLTRLVLVNRAGLRSQLAEIPGMTWFPRFSPDGGRIAYAVSPDPDLNSTADLWVVDVARGARTRVTFSGNNRFYPIWTRDGDRLTFSDGATAPNRLQWAHADGSGGLETLIRERTRRYPTSWSPDGRTLAYYVMDATAPSRDVWTAHRETDKWIESAFVETPFQESGPLFSPNGRWLAYVSTKSGVNDIYARPYPGPGNEVTVSVGGGQEPVWAPSGRELFYRYDGKLVVVSIDETATSLIVGPPSRVFDDLYRPDTGGADGGVANYDISPDGKRFVMIEEPRAANAATAPPARIQVVLNWFDELKRLVPVD